MLLDAAGDQSIRVLRLLRVFRLLRLTPLARVVFSLEGVRATVGLALLTAMVGGAGFAAEEGSSFGNGVYWAITTMTTVGYGDITPKTTEGKIIAVLVMLVGIGTATLVIGAVAQRFLAPAVEHVETAEDDLLVQVREISVQLSRLERAHAGHQPVAAHPPYGRGPSDHHPMIHRDRAAKERLRALVGAADWAPLGTEAQKRSLAEFVAVEAFGANTA